MYNENEVTNDLVAKQVEDQLRAQGIFGDEDAQKDSPISINLGGQEYTFKSREEMQATLNNAFASVAQNQAELMSQLEAATTQRNSQGAPQNTAPQLDRDKFVELIGKDPIAAFNYIDEVRYGPSRVAPELHNELSRLRNVESTMTAYRFTQTHPDFENNNENAAKLRAIATNLGLQMDYNGLEAAYTVGKSYGVFGQQQIQHAPQQANNTQAPPSINRGGNSAQDIDVENYVNTLSDSQLEQMMNRMM